MLGPAGLGSAQSPDAVPPQGTIEIQVRGIPADDATAISGQYLLDGNGTIRMPQLPPGQDVLRVVGKTARQIEDMLMAAYKKAELYTSPTFLVKVQSSDARLTEHIVLVSGGVAMKKNVLWRRGMTLLEAIVGAGDITDWGSRYVQVTRGGKTVTYDYFSIKDRAIPIQPNDRIFVPQRGILKGARQNFFPEAFFHTRLPARKPGFFIGPVFMMGEISEKRGWGNGGRSEGACRQRLMKPGGLLMLPSSGFLPEMDVFGEAVWWNRGGKEVVS